MLSERSCRDGILQVISLHALMKTPWKSVNASVLSSWSATTLTGVDTAAGSKAYWGTGHPALIADFYRCIRENVPFPIDAFEGGKAVELFLAAYRSAEQNRPTMLAKSPSPTTRQVARRLVQRNIT